MDAHTYALLDPDEPPAVTVRGATGASPFLLCCDHASNRLPRRLGTLGLPEHELRRHIAWDIGIAAVSRIMAERLDATLVLQGYSRLAIDCNRQPAAAASIPTVSELTEIPGNTHLDTAERDARVREIFRPYHDRLSALIDAREHARRRTVLIAMHSFTPVYMGVSRPWHAGVLYNRDVALPRALFDLLHRGGDLVIGDNEPYAMSDETDYTLPVHGEQRGLPHIEVEIRQDLIADGEGQRDWAERMITLLPEALARYDEHR